VPRKPRIVVHWAGPAICGRRKRAVGSFCACGLAPVAEAGLACPPRRALSHAQHFTAALVLVHEAAGVLGLDVSLALDPQGVGRIVALGDVLVITRAGRRATTVFGGTSLVTTRWAATTALGPIRASIRMLLRIAINTLSRTTIGPATFTASVRLILFSISTEASWFRWPSAAPESSRVGNTQRTSELPCISSGATNRWGTPVASVTARRCAPSAKLGLRWSAPRRPWGPVRSHQSCQHISISSRVRRRKSSSLPSVCTSAAPAFARRARSAGS